MSSDTPSTSSFTADLVRFLDSSPSPYHAAAGAKSLLVDAGFTPVACTQAWPQDTGGYVMVKDSAIVAWWLPERMDVPRAHIIGAHTDSPTFMLKPHASSRHRSGWGQLNVEVYGGMLPNSWLDRDLRLAGRVVSTDGSIRLVSTPAVARIPQLAIHLDRDQRQGLTLDPQRHLRPIWTVGEDADVIDYLADEAGLARREVAAWDVCLADAQPAGLIGRAGTLVASGRQDNLVSVYAGIRALIEAARERPDHAVVFVAFGHEEVGSGTTVGAAGPLMEEVLERLAEPYGCARSVFRRFVASSLCLSADVAHAVHPNYEDRHEPEHWPLAGGGPVLKVNANQRYATDAPGAAVWKAACEAAGVDHQVFVSNNAVACGSTIAPLTATRLGIRTIDVGAPILSMHSARELSHVADHEAMSKAMSAFATLAPLGS